MHVAASILVNTAAYGLGEGKQLIKKTDSIGSQQFNVPKASGLMKVNQKTKQKNHLKTMRGYFIFEYSNSIPEDC